MVAVGRRQHAFTLVELMIAFTVFAFGLTAVMMMQIQAMRQGAMGRHRTGATMIAQDQIERIQNTPFSDTALDVMSPLVWTTPPWLGNGGDATLDAGEIPVTVTTPGGDIRDIVFTVNYLVSADNAVTPDPNLRRVDLEIIWTEDGVGNNKPTRTGQNTVAISTMLVDNDR
jgi:Tfp pilus assembly protein PilV